MELSNNDLEEYVEKLENVFYNQKSNKKNRNELSLLIENVCNELRISRDLEKSVVDNFQKLLDSKDNDINRKYVQLEDVFYKQSIENNLLKKRVEELTIQIKLDLEAQKNEYVTKIQDIEEKCNSEITNLKNQLESGRICYEAKEKELYNDLQMAQTANALEWSEKEFNLKNQLTDATSNLRFCNSKIRSMQCEMNQLRAQLTLLKQAPKENVLHFKPNPIQQIKSNLAQKQYQFYESVDSNYDQNLPYDSYYSSIISTDVEDNNKENVDNSIDKINPTPNLNNFTGPNSTTITGKTQADLQFVGLENGRESGHNYQPLPTNCYTSSMKINKHKQSHTPEQQNMEFESHNKTSLSESKISSTVTILNKSSESLNICNKVNNNTGMRKVNIEKTPTRKNNLPALKPCSTSANVKDCKRKKRRLYDPSNSEFF
ncbi:uncharacterized protein [Diabrotica undecimpunctata]|uniref:uncharacterized protein n=1 Tax=Diabrotica undecimpunctata TaxID=50387 RepID=UPI003B63CFF6